MTTLDRPCGRSCPDDAAVLTSDRDDADLHDTRLEFEYGRGAARLASTLNGRAGIDVVLRVPPVVDVGLVPRDVRMTEQHGVGRRKPASEPSRATCGGTAVVDHGDQTAAHRDLDLLGQRETAIVVAQHCVYGSDDRERIEHVRMNQVSGVEDGVEVLRQFGVMQPLHQSSTLALLQMRVGHHEGSPRLGHGTSLVDLDPSAASGFGHRGRPVFPPALPGTSRT